ncbi:fused DSP-PTPase phosphatase/NAD kinase-like protein [Consotaella salsifontis]|uniref:Undecaprenyl-diphosphatase n=1 Tax=Consotaella salsifontis TaxID=1365950 RepID=A0A1T4MLK8_9HYPH|nr:tyrosine-protein phosphatase [Consotaella salsifontis]SJZ67664.1 undecaprenyl-diphosphatase [Consotaella salsifontis]
MEMPKLRLIAAILLLPIIAIAAPVGGYAGYLQIVGNIHTVEDGKLYRSGTLSPARLKALVEKDGIKTIVNLRGDIGSDWHKAEKSFAEAHDIAFVDYDLNAGRIPSMETMREIAETLRNAKSPILIHCKSGSDRTGLAAGIYEIAVDGETLQQAEDQLSFFYGHFPWLGSNTYAMDWALAIFADNWTVRDPNHEAPVPPASAPDRVMLSAGVQTRP